MVTASFGTHTTHRNQALEDPLLFPIEKAVERQGVFAHVGVDEEGHLGSLRRQRAKRRHADHDVVANSARLDDRLLWMFRQEPPAQVRNHALIVQREGLAFSLLV